MAAISEHGSASSAGLRVSSQQGGWLSRACDGCSQDDLGKLDMCRCSRKSSSLSPEMGPEDRICTAVATQTCSNARDTLAPRRNLISWQRVRYSYGRWVGYRCYYSTRSHQAGSLCAEFTPVIKVKRPATCEQGSHPAQLLDRLHQPCMAQTWFSRSLIKAYVAHSTKTGTKALRLAGCL